ncbi:MAG: hypothetical protein NWQ13_07395 [Glaciimonas sp.]|nr:hypothetical protein [Glaciimonas sp.]
MSAAHAEEIPMPMPEPMVGADVDAHGCKPSAGYTWSVLKKSCIRSFELPIKMQDLRNPTLGGFALMGKNKKHVEFFGNGFTPSLLLALKVNNKRGKRYGLYQSKDGHYSFSFVKNKWVLLDEKGSVKRLFEQK